MQASGARSKREAVELCLRWAPWCSCAARGSRFARRSMGSSPRRRVSHGRAVSARPWPGGVPIAERSAHLRWYSTALVFNWVSSSSVLCLAASSSCSLADSPWSSSCGDAHEVAAARVFSTGQRSRIAMVFRPGLERCRLLCGSAAERRPVTAQPSSQRNPWSSQDFGSSIGSRWVSTWVRVRAAATSRSSWSQRSWPACTVQRPGTIT